MITNWLKTNRTGLSIIFITWLTFFSRTLFAGKVYFLDDLKIIYYPLEYVYAQAQNNWQLPVWSNLFGFGQPILAWAQLGFFTPLHVLLRLFQIEPLALLQISILTYFLLGLLGMFIFLRYVKISPIAAALGSIIFTFSGFNIGHLNHVNFYTGTMILPWLLLAISIFIKNPTYTKTAFLTLLASTVALSSQPQVTLYTLIIAAIYGLVSVLSNKIKLLSTHTLKLVILTITAAVLFVGMSSFTILPLKEFIPLTERSDGVDPLQLYEFSYPPWHTITLINPYFYGNHAHYFGAKSFQELAAYTGIIPLMLAGLAFTNWKRHKNLIIFSTTLVVISILFTLGRYSPFYYWLVENHILRSLTIPGRFVYLFDVSIAILAAVGLEKVIKTSPLKKIQAFSFFLPAILLIPFFWRLKTSQPDYQRLIELIQETPSFWILPLLGFIISLAPFIKKIKPANSALTITIIASITLILYGWNYNPLTPYKNVRDHLSIVNLLRQETLPRIYSRPNIYSQEQTASRPSKKFSPDLTIIQPITLVSNPPCLNLPLNFGEQPSGQVTASLHLLPTSAPLDQITISGTDQPYRPTICFSEINSNTTKMYLKLSTNQETNINARLVSTDNSAIQAFIIRKPNPTADQINISKKPFKLVLEPKLNSPNEFPIIDRHLNTIANTSSARWIGALSLREYRAFIETFFANDRDDLLDGDGKHIFAGDHTLLNLAGVTHLAQYIAPETTDKLSELDFNLIEDININANLNARLYKNPKAFPKAFTVPNANFIPAPDETRHAMLNPNFNPKDIVYISGPIPPPEESLQNLPSPSEIKIKKYQNTQIDIQLSTHNPTWLIVTDNTTPNWHTFIDDQPAPRYTAYTIFKSAYVPAGDHTVSFKYSSPAIEKAKKLTLTSITVIIGLLLTRPLNKFFTGAKP